mgnify:CR=1 FL=1
MRISNEQLNDLVNLAKITFDGNKATLYYEDDNFIINGIYDGRADELEEVEAFANDLGVVLTIAQEDLIALHLENSYHNREELNDELRREYLEDLNYEQFKDNL